MLHKAPRHARSAQCAPEARRAHILDESALTPRCGGAAARFPESVPVLEFARAEVVGRNMHRGEVGGEGGMKFPMLYLKEPKLFVPGANVSNIYPLG